MRHHNSVFHDLLKRVPWSRFDALVDLHGADKHVRRLSTKSQLVAMLSEGKYRLSAHIRVLSAQKPS